MFKDLRLKMAVRQSFAIGLMLIAVLTLVFFYNITKLASDINTNLNELSVNEIDISAGESEYGRDAFTIFIDKEGTVYLSDIAFYSGEVVNAIIEKAREEKSENGRMVVDGNNVAYCYRNTQKGEMLYIYDFTREADNLRNTTIVILLAGVVGLVATTLLSFRSAKNSVAPVEAAFVKQQELVANASHELKTPLTIINTDLSILNSARDSLPEEQLKWLDSINGQVSRMSALVGEMLELAKVEASTEKQLRESVNLSEVTEMVVLESDVLAYEHGITIETDIQSNVGIMAVKAQIEKVLYILLDNAIKYSDKGGRVDVTLYGDRRKAVLKVRNTGQGIARENIPKLFDRFYRADEAHTESGSFGLGLAIAKSIVESHGGTIGVDSKVGEFTEFIVVLGAN